MTDRIRGIMTLRTSSAILLFLFPTLLMFPSLLKGQATTLTYVPTYGTIANPERGWCDFYSTHSGSSTLGTVYRPLHTQELVRNRMEDKVTLVWRIFYLHQFLEEDAVSQEYLDMMQADFDSIRAAGVKCIVRFSYSNSQSAETWDLPT